MHTRGRAVVLPIVLVVISLLALTMAGFIFFIRAEAAGTIAHSDAQQARLAAESGLEEVIATLRGDPHNVRAWFDAPSRFRHMLVWSSAYDRESDPVRQSGSRKGLFDEYGIPPVAWRFSVVADKYVEPTGFENRAMRFGITPESSKLNLNYATEEQIRTLLTPLLLDLRVENPEQLIAALLDWRDTDSDLREGGAENDYYNTLTPPYNAKNGPFDSVEELLLVKGFNAAVLYGEDVNRNGILDPNEDDADVISPYYDNQDGVLNRGLAPFLTVWSREPDTALDNKPRINLNQDAAVILAQVQTSFSEDELSICQGALDFIAQLKQQSFDFSQLASPADLYQGAGTVVAGEGPTVTQRNGVRRGARAGSEETGGSAATQPGEAASQPSVNPALANSPITLEQLPYIMDRFSTLATEQAGAGVAGLINVNTAPPRVLEVIPGMTPEAARMIAEMRSQFDATVLRTTAWPLTTGAVDVATFHALAPYITTKAYQYHVEVIGYADHVQAAQRCEWIIEMVGPLAQVRYRRDLTLLGWAWPIDDENVAGAGVEMGTTGP